MQYYEIFREKHDTSFEENYAEETRNLNKQNKFSVHQSHTQNSYSKTCCHCSRVCVDNSVGCPLIL